MAEVSDFCSTLSAAVHCKADAAHSCLSCHAKLPSANQAVKDRGGGGCGIGLMCNMCDQSYHVVMTSQEHQRLPINSYEGCAAAEDFTAIWGLQMNHDQTTLPLTATSTGQLWSEKIQDQLEVCDDDSNKPDELNLEELIGDENNQDLILRTQKLLDDEGNDNDHNLDTTAVSVDFPTEGCSIWVIGSSCSLSPFSSRSVLCNTLSSSFVSHGEQTFAARANAVMRYKQKKHYRVYERTIRYEKKKAIADTRKRVRGRFASN